MKTERLITYPLIVGLILVIIILSTCGVKKQADCVPIENTITLRDTIRDTTVIVEKYKPFPKKKKSVQIAEVKKQIEQLPEFDWSPYIKIEEKDEFTFFYYLDTIKGDDVEIVLLDTTMGLIVGREVKITNNRPTDIVSKYLIPKQPKIKFYVGGSVATDFKGGYQVVPNIGVQTKSEWMITAGAGLSQSGLIYQAGIFARIGKK